LFGAQEPLFERGKALLAANNSFLPEQKRCWRRGFAQKVGMHVVSGADEVKVAQPIYRWGVTEPRAVASGIKVQLSYLLNLPEHD
jgi:hypothetical protein